MCDSFVFLRSMKDAISKAPPEKQIELYEALFDFALDDIEPEDYVAQIVIEAFRVPLGKAKKRYETQVENGKKGGAPVGNRNAKKDKQPKSTQTTQTTQNNPDVDVDVDVDEEEKEIKDFCSELSAGADAPSQPPEKTKSTQTVLDAFEAVISLPLNDSSEFHIPESQIQLWTELYPAVDIMQALRNMKGWLHANPTKRKTKKGIARFINNWLAKEQDKGGSGQRSPPGSPRPLYAHETKYETKNERNARRIAEHKAKRDQMFRGEAISHDHDHDREGAETGRYPVGLPQHDAD